MVKSVVFRDQKEPLKIGALNSLGIGQFTPYHYATRPLGRCFVASLNQELFS